MHICLAENGERNFSFPCARLLASTEAEDGKIFSGNANKGEQEESRVTTANNKFSNRNIFQKKNVG